MEIAICVTNDGASDRRMMRIARSLQSVGHRVTIIGRKDPYRRSDLPDDVAITQLASKPLRGPRFYLNFNLELIKHLCGARYDLYYAVDLDTLYGVSQAARKMNRPFIYDAHELYADTPELLSKPIKRNLWMQLGKARIPQATDCLTVGTEIARRLSARYGREFNVLRNMPDKRPEVAPGHIQDRVQLAYLGVLNPGRGLDHLLALVAEHAQYDLHLIGDGVLQESLRAEAARLDITDRVIFYGWKSAEEAHKILCKAHIGLSLLDPRSESYRLSLANKYYDYVQAGLPAVHMDFPEYRQGQRQFPVAYLCDEYSTAGLRRAVGALVQDTQWYSRCRAACLEARNVWCWEREAERLYELIPPAI